MFSSFGGSGDGISFDDFFGFSEETSSVVVESKQITQVVSSSVNKKVDAASSSDKKQAKVIQDKTVSKVTPNIPKNQPSNASSSEESEEESSSDNEQMKVIQISDDDDEEMKENDSSSTTSSSDSGDSDDEESENIVTRKLSSVVEKQTISKPLLKTNVEKKVSPPKQSTLQQILNNTSSTQAAIVEPKKKKPSPVKEKESPKRKFIQTRLDKSMFEKRAEQPQGTDSSLFCVCCNMFIALTSASSQNSAKRVKKGSSRYEEWNQHITCEEHLLRKERLQRLNVLCFMNGPSSKRFHHFVNSFCLMFFHKIEAFAVEFSKKNRKRSFEIEDCEDHILLDYVINFIYARVSDLKYTTDFEKILKMFLNSMRQNSLKIATTIWEQNKEFYNKMADDDFGYLLSDIVHRSWDCMRHLAYFGKVQDPVHLFIDEPLEFEDYIKNEDKKILKDDSDSSSSEEESDDDEEDDIFSAQHPYFETFMKMYIQYFLFLIPIEKIMSEAVEMYKSILEEGTYFDEWEVEILKRKTQFLSQSENNSEQNDNESSGEESPTIPLPKPQAPKQKSIEDLLFGSAANNTFESFFSINTTPKKPIIVPNQTQGKKNTQPSTIENETMEEEDMWSLLRRDNM